MNCKNEDLERIIIIKERVLNEVSNIFKERINEELLLDSNNCLEVLDSLEKILIDIKLEIEALFFDNSISYLDYEVRNKKYLLIMKDLYLVRYDIIEE